MLILARRVGETVMIGNEVTITILAIKGHQVRVGINAPKTIAVYREEVYERIQREHAGESGDEPNERTSRGTGPWVPLKIEELGPNASSG